MNAELPLLSPIEATWLDFIRAYSAFIHIIAFERLVHHVS